MKPTTARIVMTVIILAVVIIGVSVVNSSYHGSFFAGLLIIVLPFLGLAYLLPHVLPVKCPRCRARMRFHFVPRRVRSSAAGADEAKQLYGYACDACQAKHLWEGVSLGSALD